LEMTRVPTFATGGHSRGVFMEKNTVASLFGATRACPNHEDHPSASLDLITLFR